MAKVAIILHTSIKLATALTYFSGNPIKNLVSPSASVVSE